MLWIFCRANRYCAASWVNPLKPHWVSCTGPTTQIEASRWNALPSIRRYHGWLFRMSEPSGWIRLPSATSDSASASTIKGIMSGGVAMSASANRIRSVVAWSMPTRTAAPLPPCGTLIRASSVSGRARTMSAVASVLPSSTTRTSTRSGSVAEPGTPSRPNAPRRWRYPNSSSSAGSIRSASLNAGRTSVSDGRSGMRRSLSDPFARDARDKATRYEGVIVVRRPADMLLAVSSPPRLRRPTLFLERSLEAPYEPESVVDAPLIGFDAFSIDQRIFGWVRLSADRLTDFLNAHEEIELDNAQIEQLTDARVASIDRLVVNRDRLIAVRAGGPQGDPARRQRLRLHPLVVRAGLYRIGGYLHARPGVEPL